MPLPKTRPRLEQQSEKPRRRLGAVLGIVALLAALTGLLLVPSARARVTGLLASGMSIRQILIEAGTDLDMDKIATSCLQNMGCSLLLVSSRRICGTLECFPTVKSVTVKRRFPSTLVVQVVAREPRFKVKLDGEWWGLSDDGVVLPLADDGRGDACPAQDGGGCSRQIRRTENSPRGEHPYDLPVVSGLTFEGDGAGARVRDDFFVELVGLCDYLGLCRGGACPAQNAGGCSRQIRRTENSPRGEHPYNVAGIDVIDRMEVRLTPHNPGLILVFSLTDYERQTAKYNKAMPQVCQRSEEFKVADLRFRGQVVLKKNTE